MMKFFIAFGITLILILLMLGCAKITECTGPKDNQVCEQKTTGIGAK